MPKWKTITLPETTIDEIKNNMKGFTSLSEFVRAAVRFYVGHLAQSRETIPEMGVPVHE